MRGEKKFHWFYPVMRKAVSQRLQTLAEEDKKLQLLHGEYWPEYMNPADIPLPTTPTNQQ